MFGKLNSNLLAWGAKITFEKASKFHGDESNRILKKIKFLSFGLLQWFDWILKVYKWEIDKI
jgi:hypothetical protein